MNFTINIPNKQKIKLIATDFDGVLTDGFVYYSSVSDEEAKRLCFKDIMGMSLAIRSGFKIAVISGENNKIIDRLTSRFNIEEVHKGIRDKRSVLISIAEKYNLSPQEVLYFGDDINDIEALKWAGTAFTVPDSHFRVKEIENIIITKSPAGNGAFREIVDTLLEA